MSAANASLRERALRGTDRPANPPLLGAMRVLRVHDDDNFGFIKEFIEDIKVNFVAFISKFHANGRLVRGSNCFFIVLILKKEK